MTRRPPAGLTVATAIALVILVGLGVWQLQRLAWKRDLIQRIEASQTAPGQPLGEVLREGEGSGVYGVVFRGRRYDTGDKLSYLKACIELACEREDLGPELREWLPDFTASLPK